MPPGCRILSLEEEGGMNLVLWALQAILAIKLLSAAYTHGVRPDASKMQRGVVAYGAATRPLLVVIAGAVTLAAVALVVPGLTGLHSSATVLAAAAVAVLMLVAIVFHVRCRDKPVPWVGLVLAAMAAFVAYGRWALVPF
jgi:hypothetical protein